MQIHIPERTNTILWADNLENLAPDKYSKIETFLPVRPGKPAGWKDGQVDRCTDRWKRALLFMTPLLESLPVISKGTWFWFFFISGFFPCMFADCLITSLGFGTHTLQIHDHLSHYLHIFPLRIIIALTTTAHVLMSCRPGHTEVIIFWKWSWWVRVVCTISNKQDEVGRFPSPPLLSGSKNHIPLMSSRCHAGRWGGLCSPEKWVSTKRRDKTQGMLDCICLSTD